MATNLVNAFKPFIKVLSRRYTAAQLEVSDFTSEQSIKEIIYRFTNELAIAGVDPESLVNYGMDVLNEMDFETYPPRPRQFALRIQDKKRLHDFFSDGMEWALPVLEELYHYFERRYNYLWHKSGAKTVILISWGTFVFDYKMTESSLKAGIERLKNDFMSNKYPPSEPDVEIAFCCAIKDADIPSPKEAFRIASEKGFSDEINPIIAYARQQFGFYRLKTSVDGAMEKEFTEVYKNVIRDYVKGIINPYFDQESMRSNEQDMFGDVNKKKYVSANGLSNMLSSI